MEIAHLRGGNSASERKTALVAGGGGHGISRLSNDSDAVHTPRQVADGVVLEHYDDRNYGYLKVAADKRRLQIEFRQAGAKVVVADTVTVDLQTRKLVNM